MREFLILKWKLQGGEKTLAFDVTQEQREEELMPMLQELTPENPGEKMRAKTDSKAYIVSLTAASTPLGVY